MRVTAAGHKEAAPAWGANLSRWYLRVFSGLTVAMLAAIAIEWLWVFAHPANLAAELGGDFTIYTEAARRWLGGGSFYAAYQFVGPYELVQPAVLYPPTLLPLLVPFAVLPAWLAVPLWWGVPLLVTALVVRHHHPALWAWPLILLCLAYGQTGAILLNGTPTLWILMFVALGTVYRPAFALVTLKPSVFPLALLGLRDRRWWLVGIALGVMSLPLLPLWLDWITVIRNGTGERANLLYSLLDLPLYAMPLVAWAARCR